MSIRRHPTKAGHWQIIVSQGAKGKQLVFPVECDEAHALALDKQLNAQIKGTVQSIYPTITEALPSYIEYYSTIASEDIQADMASVMRRCLLPHFGRLQAGQITPILVHQYTAKRLGDKIMMRSKNTERTTDRKVSHRTIEKELNYLSAMCRWMHINGMAEKMPAIPKPPKNKTQPKTMQQPLTLDEVNALLEKTADDKKVLILLMTDAGLRCQEALQLRVADIDDKGCRLTVHGKGGKVVVYPILTKRLLESIQNATNKTDTEWLVTNPRTKKPIQSIKTMLRLTSKRAGITKHVTHHTLRHTFSTLLLQCGISTEVRQRLMRHSTLAATQKYTHVSPDFLLQQATGFSDMIDRGSETLKVKTPRKPARAHSSAG